jgi:hypothetical protein
VVVRGVRVDGRVVTLVGLLVLLVIHMHLFCTPESPGLTGFEGKASRAFDESADRLSSVINEAVQLSR